MKFLALINFFLYLSENNTNLNMHILFFVVVSGYDKNVDIKELYLLIAFCLVRKSLD